MEHAEKMYLVPTQQLERLNIQRPWEEESIRHTVVHSLDKEMKTVLERGDLSEYEKAKLYGSLLQKYLTHVRTGEEEKTKLNLYFPQPELTPVPEGKNDSIFEEILENLSPRYRTNARVLLKKIDQNRDITSWDGKGTFLYRGTPVTGSHMLDLVKAITHTSAPSSSLQPKGMEVFMTALAEINVPSSVARAPATRKMLEDLKSSPSPFLKRTPVISSKKQKASPLLVPSKRKKQRMSNWLTEE